MATSDCPSVDDLRCYTVGLMPEVTAAVLEEHLLTCDKCESTLALLDDSRDPLICRLRNIEPAPQEEASLQALICELDKLHLACSTDTGAPLPSRIGRYQPLAKVGEGGGGVVFKARHVDLGKVVALKLLTAERLHSPTAQARFIREMKAVGRLDHPNIVAALDAGGQEQQPYLAMEFIEGVVVSRIAVAAHQLRVADACEIIRQTTLGLAAAHLAGLIHRDIKPSNLMITDKGVVKVLDLGLARFEIPSDDENLTGDGRVVGTATYIAPEQALQDGSVDCRADLYSAGATLFKLLAGQPPFSGSDYDTPLKKVLGHVRDVPPQIELFRSDVPVELSAIIQRLLAKSPSARMDTAEQLADALAPFAVGADLAGLVRNTRLALTDATASAEDTERSFSRQTFSGTPQRLKLPAARRHPRTRLWLAGGVAALALITLLAIRYARQDSRIEARPPVIPTVVVPQPSGGAAVAADAQNDNRPAVLDLTTYQEFLGPRQAHENGAVDAVAFSGDGHMVATGGADAQIRLWNVSPWKRLAELPKSQFSIASLKFLPGQRRLLAVSSNQSDNKGQACIWKLPEGEQPAQQLAAYEGVRAADASADGEWLATVGYATGLRIRNLASGAIVKEFGPESGRLLRFSPDGKWLVLIDDNGGAQLIPTLDWSAQRYFSASLGAIRDVAFSPDGSAMATCGGLPGRGIVAVFDVATVSQRKLITYDGAQSERIAFLPGGQSVVAGGDDKSLRVWDVPSGQLVQRDEDRKIVVSSLAVSFDARQLIVGRSDGTIELNHLDGAGRLIESGQRRKVADHPHTEMILSVAFSPDSKLIASAGDDGQVMISDVASGRMLLRLNVPQAAVGGVDQAAGGSYDAVTFSPNGKFVAAAGLRNSDARVWKVATGQLEQTFPDGDQAVSLDYSPDGHWLAMGGKGISICNANDGSRIHQLDVQGFFCHSIRFSPDGRLLAAGGFLFEGTSREETACAIIWDAATGQELKRIGGQPPKITCVQFTPDGKQLATGGFEPGVRLWNVETGKLIKTLPALMGNSFAFRPDGQLLFAPGGCWDVASGKQTKQSKAKLNIYGVAMSPDGQYVASANRVLLIEAFGKLEEVKK